MPLSGPWKIRCWIATSVMGAAVVRMFIPRKKRRSKPQAQYA
jgi:hypothetical protein